MTLAAALAAAAAIAVVAVPHSAHASGRINLQDYFAVIETAFEQTIEPVSEPVVMVAGGAGDDGMTAGLTVGWASGQKVTAGIFPGTSVSRVLADVHRMSDRSSVALTYGWFDNSFFPLGLDFGATGQRDDDGDLRVGPLARMTFGGPVAVRLSGDIAMGDSTQFDGQVELVLDLTRMAKPTSKARAN